MSSANLAWPGSRLVSAWVSGFRVKGLAQLRLEELSVSRVLVLGPRRLGVATGRLQA